MRIKLDLYNLLTHNIYILILLVLVVLILLFLYVRKFGKIVKSELKKMTDTMKSEIRSSVQSKFIEISPESDIMVQLAIDIWRLEKKMDSILKKLADKERQSLTHSISRIKHQLSKFDIEVKDYNNEKYNDGLNIDVISAEKDKTINDPYIKETIDPAVMIKGLLVKRAKVIIVTKGTDI